MALNPLLASFISDQQGQAAESRQALQGAKANELGLALGDLKNRRAVGAANSLAQAKLAQERESIRGRQNVSSTGAKLENSGLDASQNKQLRGDVDKQQFNELIRAVAAAGEQFKIGGGTFQPGQLSGESLFGPKPVTIQALGGSLTGISGTSPKVTVAKQNKRGSVIGEDGYTTTTNTNTRIVDPEAQKTADAIRKMINDRLNIGNTQPDAERPAVTALRARLEALPSKLGDEYRANPADFIFGSPVPSGELGWYRESEIGLDGKPNWLTLP